MIPATFGDFLRQADGHLDAALAGWDQVADPAAAACELRRVVTVMTRFLDDRIRVDVIEAAGRTDLNPWERATIDTRTALRQAADCLTQDSEIIDGTGSRPGRDPARSLAAAATCLTAGRDLLNTHTATSPQDLREHRSDWAPTLVSLPVTRALTAQIARWSRQLVSVTAILASADPAATPAAVTAGESLQAASQWLWAAGTAIRPAQAADPATAEDSRLLQAIPAAQPPARLPPGGAEPVTELCAGLTASAQRLRAAIFTTAGQAPWMPSLTADTWRWTARAIAVTGHASELTLRSLTRHPGQPGSPLDGPQLQAAAEATARSWAAWRQVSAAWTGLTTETHGQASPVVPEINDLVLRMGRLAWNDPHWTPARRPAATRRDPATLISSDAGIAAVVSAVHQAADAFARIAAADLKAVSTAGGAGRLYVTTRSLPQGYDVPRPYATAPADRTSPLLHAYQAAVQASTRAADTLAAVALASNAPSSTLALARAAARPRRDQAVGEDQRLAAAVPATRTGTTRPIAGPVERAVRQLRVTDPGLLLRVAAIDGAARQLLVQAAAASPPSGLPSNTAAVEQRAPGSPAQLAAKDSPASPAAWLAAALSRNHPATAATRPDASRTPQAPPVQRSGGPGRTSA
jgi:hypothetical protein